MTSTINQVMEEDFDENDNDVNENPNNESQTKLFFVNWRAAERKYEQLAASGPFAHYPPGTWIAVDDNVGLICAGEDEERVVEQANAVSQTPFIIQIGIPPIVYHVRSDLRSLRSADSVGGLGLGTEPLGARLTGTIFSHTEDDRAWSYCRICRATGTGSNERRKLLLDWGANMSAPTTP